MGEHTREGGSGGLPDGAAATAPTAPHATPPRAPDDQKTGPARFWGSKRWPLAGAILASFLAHWLVGPFSILPSGPDIEIKDQDGELTIPIEALQSGLEEPTHPAEPPPTATGGGANVPPVQGLGLDAGPDARLRDAGPDAQPLATLGDSGLEGDGAALDASTEDGSDGGLPTLDEAGVALGGTDGGAEGGSASSDPRALLGAAGGVSAGPVNIQVAVNMAVIKTHPAAPRLAPILAAIPQWKQFMAGSAIDPMRDCDWIFILGPSLIDTEKDAVFVHYSASDVVVDTAIGNISKSYAKGGPIDVGVPKVKAWRAYADRGERVFLRPSPGVAVIVPSSHANQFARVLVGNPVKPNMNPGEAARIVALRPGGSISAIPASISEMRLWVVPRNADGGADVYAEGDCPDPAAAAQAAADLKDTIQKKNSFGVRLVTGGLFNSVDVTSSGSLVKAHLSASRDQIDAVLGLVAGQVGATLPPPPTAPPPPTSTTPQTPPASTGSGG